MTFRDEVRRRAAGQRRIEGIAPVLMEVPAPSAGPPVRRWVRRGLIALAIVVIVAAAATARLFVWPDWGRPARVSAIVMLDVPNATLATALSLAAQHRAPYLVISLGTPESGYGCPRPVPRVTLICFNPSPGTTREKPNSSAGWPGPITAAPSRSSRSLPRPPGPGCGLNGVSPVPCTSWRHRSR